MRSGLVSLLLVFAAMLTAQAPATFEVATVRPTAGPIPGVPAFLGNQHTTPDTLTARHTQIRELIKRAYSVSDPELVGGPAWTQDARFDVVAKSAKPATDAELWKMMQPLLEERFHFKYHREPRQVSGMALVIGKNGPKLTRSEGGSSDFSGAGGKFSGHNVPIVRLTELIAGVLRQPVVDATGLEGGFDFAIDPRKYAGDQPTDLQSMLITAVQEDLGLKLEGRKVEIQVMVIDHIEQPDAN